MDAILSPATARRCFIRSNMLNMAYSTQGLQSMGFLFSIIPGLRELHKNDTAFAQSCARYSAHFNCNVFWAPFLCGAFLHAERQIASGALSREMLDVFKETTLNSLSAVGDSFISGSLVSSIMLILSCMAVMGNTDAMLVFLLLWFAVAIILKILTFYLGLFKGFRLLNLIRRLNLINKSDYIKIFNAILVVVFLVLALGFPLEEAISDPPWPTPITDWFLPVGTVTALSYAITRLHLSRTLVVLAITLGASFFL